MRDSRFGIRVTRLSLAGLGVAVGLALQPAHAGERRKDAAIDARALAVHHVVFVAPARSFGKMESASGTAKGESVRAEGAGRRTDVGGQRTEALTFPSVTWERGKTEGGTGKGPSTAPRERKSLTFFRLDPKFGDVSVQPVVGGVNGAQVSMGF